MRRLIAALVITLGLLAPGAVSAQPRPTGYVSIFLDRLPNRDATELRARALAEEKVEAGPHLRLTVSGFVEGLLADRRGRVTDAIAEPQDVSVEFHASRFDLLAGLGRVVWGRLDELQPTDVVNPIEVSRFLFEGRSEARLPVPLVRGRMFASDRVSIEGVYVPVFRQGRFDRLDERTSPFNLEPAVPFLDAKPARRLESAQGGARLNATSGRVDWSVSAYRGFRPFGLFATVPPPPVPPPPVPPGSDPGSEGGSPQPGSPGSIRDSRWSAGISRPWPARGWCAARSPRSSATRFRRQASRSR